MNFVLKEPRADGGYFIISVVRDGDQFLVRSKRIDGVGNILVWNDVNAEGTFRAARYNTLAEAKERAKTIAGMKRKRQGMIPIEEKDLPSISVLKNRLAAKIDAQVNTEELLTILENARKERYVVFKDIAGLEDFFDLGVEYVGNVTDDPTLMEVFDKFGESRSVLVDRLDSINKTEQALEAAG